ncbi:MAG: type II toxin-antitoxin system HipA family toxin [Acidimicrobiales bacterium]|nr:type II toxin-antitoxin system HipA family toxin [Acidimicrobiales bacterium]
MTSSDATVGTLVVLLDGSPIGRVERGSGGLRLLYDDGYVDDPSATPLSVAMAPPVRAHTDRVVAPWLWGLLPDNADVLDRWGREFGVSVASPFPLLSTQVGHDCAGAVQFCAPDALDALIGRPGEVEPLTEGQVASRLRQLRSDTTTWLGPGFTGQFSLAGAQAKTALTFDEVGGWGQPHGSAATTHILKPAVVGLDGHDLNEHLCLAAARRCGLSAARTRVEAFEDQTAIVVDRYDRRIVDGELVRIHQEDICQALGVRPGRKYQSEGGPSPADVAGLLRSVMPTGRAIDALGRFVDALAFNWIVAGTDAHAKNYSLLHAGHETRLAPLYDIASALPYDTSNGRKLKLAMKLGGEYRLTATDRPSSWRNLAEEVGLPYERVAAQVTALTQQIAPAFAEVAADPVVADLASDLPDRLVAAVATRAEHCARVLA